MKKNFLVLLVVILFLSITSPAAAQQASLYLAPSRGTFLIGSTFSVSIYVDTKGSKINVVELDLKFPSDLLQVTSPTAGESFVSQWLTPPSYSNEGGTISFKGGIPEGIVTSAGLVSTITFRARSAGIAGVEFLDSSKVLLADGKGTPVFTTNIGGIYEILIPPPEGPKINSPTHPDQEIWYGDPNPQFSWEKEEGVGDELRSSSPFASARVADFSYSFSQNPKEVPDTISEGDSTFKVYENAADGIWYFHLRQNKNGVWGKTSHFQTKIDTTPPQKFKIKAEIYSGFIYFETKDIYSGIDHYEISVTNLSQVPTPSPFFVEAASPYKIPHQEPGKYRVQVRAYDRVGNFETAEIEFQKLSPFISLVEQKGMQIKGFFISWQLLFLGLFLGLVFFGYFLFYLMKPKTGFKKGIKEIEEALAEIKKIEGREKELEEKRKEFEKEKEKLEEKLK